MRQVKLQKTINAASNKAKEFGMFGFQHVHTGPDSTDPGVLKAKEDKAKRDAVLLEYSKKVKEQKANAMNKVKNKN